MEEIATFASYYFDSTVSSKRNRPVRNDPRAIPSTVAAFSIFNYPSRPSRRKPPRYLTTPEKHAAETYVLLNCPEVEPIYRYAPYSTILISFEWFRTEHIYGGVGRLFVSQYDGADLLMDKIVAEHFLPWFKTYVSICTLILTFNHYVAYIIVRYVF